VKLLHKRGKRLFQLQQLELEGSELREELKWKRMVEGLILKNEFFKTLRV